MRFSIIAAVDYHSAGIGVRNTIPWHIPADLKYFHSITTDCSDHPDFPYVQNAVIMGYKTYMSLPNQQPLPGRINIVVSQNSMRKHASHPDVVVVDSLEDALTTVESTMHVHQPVPKLFVIGGEQLYYSAIVHPECEKVYLTHISAPEKFDSGDFDAFFPGGQSFIFFPKNFGWIAQEEEKKSEGEKEGWQKVGEYSYRFKVLVRDPETTVTKTLTDFMMAALRDARYDLSVLRNQYRQFKTETCREEEAGYLQLVKQVILFGEKRVDRTNIGTFSMFGPQLSFSLKHNRFPLLTTKRVNFANVAKELLWFVSGNTDSEMLNRQDVPIWNANGSREFLDQRGLRHREVGDLGPVYGFQWRFFGAQYVDKHTSYADKGGVDQLKECIRLIREDPYSRRIIQTAWNPAQLHEMALPPCHILVQFYVSFEREYDNEEDEEWEKAAERNQQDYDMFDLETGVRRGNSTTTAFLNCKMYQRSADLGLGVPYNIASYSLLTIMIAHVCNMKPGKLVLTFGDAHVYQNHVEKLSMQLQRVPREFPTLKIIGEKKETIDDFELQDFVVENYDPYPFIALPMAV